MPANEVLWKHENECCLLKRILAVKNERGIGWDSQEPLMRKTQVLITPLVCPRQGCQALKPLILVFAELQPRLRVTPF